MWKGCQFYDCLVSIRIGFGHYLGPNFLEAIPHEQVQLYTRTSAATSSFPAVVARDIAYRQSTWNICRGYSRNACPWQCILNCFLCCKVGSRMVIGFAHIWRSTPSTIPGGGSAIMGMSPAFDRNVAELAEAPSWPGTACSTSASIGSVFMVSMGAPSRPAGSPPAQPITWTPQQESFYRSINDAPLDRLNFLAFKTSPQASLRSCIHARACQESVFKIKGCFKNLSVLHQKFKMWVESSCSSLSTIWSLFNLPCNFLRLMTNTIIIWICFRKQRFSLTH